MEEHDWRARLEAALNREADVRRRLPDFSDVCITPVALSEAAARARLLPIYVQEGHGASPTDDDTYDEAERVMRSEGRHDEADAFHQKRPPRREPTLEDLFGRAVPDTNRLGRRRGRFEVRFTPVRARSDTLRLRTLRAFQRPDHTRDVARLDLVGSQLFARGRWCDVEVDVLREALDATRSLVGDLPNHVPKPWAACPEVGHGGECGSCGREIPAHGLILSYVEEGDPQSRPRFVAGRLHLGCAHRADPQSLVAAVEYQPGAREHLDEVAVLERGRVARCHQCRGIIRRDDWRLVCPYVERTYDLDCGVTAVPGGFADALARVEGMEDVDAWRSKLSESVDQAPG